jgi:hypothetical protein
MSLASKSDIYRRQVKSTIANPQSRGFLLSLVCIGVFLVLVSLIFPPMTSGIEQANAVWLIGP